jgi:squalene-hopene/tetraprenyl-beta-curcumene cyclase
MQQEVQSRPDRAVGLSPLDIAIERAQAALLNKQDRTGYWCGELQGDSILESEYILLRFMLSQEDEAELPRIANYLRSLQQTDGGWSMYPGGAPDLSGTVKAYFALKLMGDDPNAPHMQRAREVVLKLGGAERSNSFSKFYLSGLGQVPYSACPIIPPEIVFLPKWAYFNLYSVSAWTRTMILPLAITTIFKPVRQLPLERGIRELFLIDPKDCPTSFSETPPKGWKRFFLFCDSLMKAYEKSPIKPFRKLSLKKAEKWLVEHMQNSEGLGAIFPPMVYIQVALRQIGYPDNHPLLIEADKHLKALMIKEPEAIRIQPCFSPVWDSGIALHALAETDLSINSDEAKQATKWLLAKECRKASDWQMNCAKTEAAGWFFEFDNPHYPDVDDTAMVAMALQRLGGEIAQPAVQRGKQWLFAMQNDDGGWAAFDRTRDKPILEKIPFADHNAMQDPSCPDITGRVLECLGHLGMRAGTPSIDRAVKFIRSHQDASGAWWGRWGVNYVYGSWQVLAGFRAVGVDMQQDFVQRAAAWLKSVQKPDGSFGESCDSYEDPSLKGQGPSTPSQTAWGTMGLLAACGPHDPAAKAGIQWLIDQQPLGGEWTEDWFTGTGFPRVFYLKYHLYKLYFPLMALGRYRKLSMAV